MGPGPKETKDFTLWVFQAVADLKDRLAKAEAAVAALQKPITPTK